MKTEKDAKKVAAKLLKELGPDWTADNFRRNIEPNWIFDLLYGSLFKVRVMRIGSSRRLRYLVLLPVNHGTGFDSGRTLREALAKCFERSQGELEDLEERVDTLKNVREHLHSILGGLG